jgi:hypothetical protein
MLVHTCFTTHPAIKQQVILHLRPPGRGSVR